MVPFIAAALASPLVKELFKWGFSSVASVVASKGKEVVEEKFGVKLDDMLGSEEGRFKLKQLEIEHEEFLLEMREKSEARDYESFKTEVEDRASARFRDSEFIKNSKENWRGHAMFLLAVAVCCWLTWIIWKSPDLGEYTKGIFTLVLGRFLGYLDNIYNFEFGTTRQNRNKDQTIKNLSGGDK